METTTKWKVQYVARSGSREWKEELILAEYHLDIYLDGAFYTQLVCTPCELEELILGRLLTEGVIKEYTDVKSLSIDESRGQAAVCLQHKNTGGMRDCVKAGYIWKEEWIFRLAKSFAGDTKLHRSTSGTHSCYLAHEDKVLFVSEDIGRHNAMDKVLGKAVKEKICLEESMLYTSGRVPEDMMRKAIGSGVPLLISKAIPTAAAIELARKHGITLIGGARCDQIKIYTDFRGERQEAGKEYKK